MGHPALLKLRRHNLRALFNIFYCIGETQKASEVKIYKTICQFFPGFVHKFAVFSFKNLFS